MSGEMAVGKREKLRRLLVYDIDGTLTRPGRDLWLLSMQRLVRYPHVFEERVSVWRRSLAVGLDPFEESMKMMDAGLEMLQDGVDGERVARVTDQLINDMFDSDGIYPGALEHLSRASSAGAAIAFSTTNYREGAEALLLALVNRGVISSERTFVSGTVIDWKSRRLEWFNMAERKIDGLCDVLGLETHAALRV